MTAPSVLVVWEHGGNLGHIARLLPVARTLRDQGHPVVFAVAQSQAVAPLLANTGVTIVQAPQVSLALPYTTSAACPADIWLRCGFASPPHAKACVLQWLALFEEVKPAAILVDASPVALYAAQVAGIHAVALGNGFELPPTLPGQSFTPWQDDQAAGIAYSERVLASALMGLAAGLAKDFPSNKGSSNGVYQANSVSAVLSLSPQALCTWPELDHFDRAPDVANFVGPIWKDLPGAQTISWPGKLGAKVLCYLTLTDKRYDFLWQALQMHGANVLLVSPAGIDWACESARSWGITVCRKPVAMGSLLTDCDAVIGYGGTGWASMALLGGKPLMLLPMHLEQGLLAYRLTQRGLAVSSLSLLNKEQVQARVAQLLQGTALQERCKQLSQRYAGYEPQQAVDRVVAKLVNGIESNSMNTTPECVTCSPL